MSRVSPIFWGKFLKWFWQTSICDLPPFNGQNSLTLSLSRATFILAHGNPNPRSGPFHWRRYHPRCFTKVRFPPKNVKHTPIQCDLIKVVVSKILYFHPYVGKIPSLTISYFSRGLKPPTREHTLMKRYILWHYEMTRSFQPIRYWPDAKQLVTKNTFFVHLSP